VQGSPQVFRVDSIHVRPYSYPSTLYTISRPQLVNAWVYDAVDGQPHPLVAPLTVTLSSSNTQALTLAAPTVTIPAGSSYSNYDTLRVVGVVDSAFIRTSAPGSSPDSTNLIHVLPTQLAVNIVYPYQAGRLLRLQSNYVSIPDVAPSPVTVTLAGHRPASDTLSVSTVTIAQGSSTSAPFEVVAVDSTGSDSITADATGFVQGFGRFSAVPAALTLSSPGTTHLTTEPAQLIYLYTRMRPYPYYAQTPATPITVGIRSSDSTVIRIDSAGIVIRGDSATSVVTTGQYYGYLKVRYVGPGTAYLRISAPGFSPDSTSPISVTGPSLHISNPTVTVGQSQIFTGQYVYVDNIVTGSPLVVHLTRSDSTASPANQVFGLSADSVIVTVGSYYSNALEITGRSTGSALLIARATGYTQATVAVSVGQPQLFVPSTLSLYVGAPPTSAYVYSQDQGGNYRAVATPTVVSTSSSDATVAIADSATLTIATGANYATTGVRGLKTGSTAMVFSSPSYKPDTIVVSVDTARLFLPTGVTVPVGQTVTNTMYVQIPFVPGSPVTVNLTSSNPSVLTVPSSVTIPTNSTYVYITVTGVAAGSATLSATATGFRPATPVSVTVQ
jgi:hypothetical protein